MFATLFLILFLRYQKKIPIALILLTACISLHRLTGFIAILYILITFVIHFFEKKKSYNYWLFVGIIL